MIRTYWNIDHTPIAISLDKLLYDIRKDDGADGLIFDAVSFADIIEDADGRIALDAMLSPYNKLETKMGILQKVMERAGTEIKPVSQQLSEPFTQNGTANVACIFELSDGQTISVFFHNPDTTPKKIMPTDEMVSWKWLLNKKDITIVVAPEKGKDLNVRQVATRLMKLAEKNSPAFQRTNAKRAEKMQALEGLKTEVAGLEKTLKDKQHELEVAKIEAEDRGNQANQETTEQTQATPEVITTTINTNNAPESLKPLIDKINTLFSQAAEKGLNPISKEQFMTDIANGNRLGFSLETLKNHKAETLKLIADLASGKTTPRKIVGVGGTKAAANKWLNGQLNEDSIAIESGGFLKLNNLYNYQSYLNDLIKNGQDTSFESDDEMAKKESERLEKRAIYDEKILQEDALLAANKSYSVGDDSDFKRPLELKFTISVEKRDLFLKLLEAVTPQEKYEVLISNEDNAKMEQQDFKLTVDLNGALKKGIKFGYFKLQQRAGYSVATVTIDLASTQTEVAPVEAEDLSEESVNVEINNYFKKSHGNVFNNVDFVVIEQHRNVYLIQAMQPYEHLVKVMVKTPNGIRELNLIDKPQDVFEATKDSNNLNIWSVSIDAIGTHYTRGILNTDNLEFTRDDGKIIAFTNYGAFKLSTAIGEETTEQTQATPEVKVTASMIEYITQDVFKGKSLKSAINEFIKKFNGQNNMFLGGLVNVTFDALMNEYIKDHCDDVVKALAKDNNSVRFEMFTKSTSEKFGIELQVVVDYCKNAINLNPPSIEQTQAVEQTPEINQNLVREEKGIKVGESYNNEFYGMVKVTEIELNEYQDGDASISFIGENGREQAQRLTAFIESILNREPAPVLPTGIDPVAKSNIEAANISAAIKKKAIAYLNANPASHEIKGLSTKSLDAIMENIKTALFAEVKSLSPLIKQSKLMGGDSLILNIADDGKDSIKILFSDGSYRLSFMVVKDFEGEEIFDSTSTIEGLREWGFALPFDLDVKAFVANVIKPVVDEFLIKHEGVKNAVISMWDKVLGMTKEEFSEKVFSGNIVINDSINPNHTNQKTISQMVDFLNMIDDAHPNDRDDHGFTDYKETIERKISDLYDDAEVSKKMAEAGIVNHNEYITFLDEPAGSEEQQKTTGKIEGVKNLIGIALSRTDGNKAFSEIGEVSPEVAEKVKLVTGIDVDGFVHGIDEAAIRHVFEEHGDVEAENKRGQIAVTAHDIANLSAVVISPDDIQKGDEENTIEVSKRIGSEVLVVQEIRTGRKKLVLKTMWKKPISAPDAPLEVSPAEASETFGNQAQENTTTNPHPDTTEQQEATTEPQSHSQPV